MDNIKRIDRKLAHKGSIVEFYTDYMELPDHKIAKWDFIKHKGAAAIVPVTSDGKIVMVHQYRNSIERETLEIPAGAVNPGETKEQAAIRECEEETGFKALEVKHLFDLYTTVAFCNEQIGIYYTTHLEQGTRHLDEDEYVNVEIHDLDALIQMIYDGKIQDAKTMSALLAYKQLAKM